MFSDSNNAYWQTVSLVLDSPSLFIVVNNTDFIIGRISTDVKGDLSFMRIKYGSTNVIWSSSILWKTTGCYDQNSDGILSEDSSKFYSWRLYGVNPYYILFNTFNASDGTAIGNRYVSSVRCTYVSIALKSKYLVLAVVCNSIPTVALYDYSNDYFMHYYELISGSGVFYKIVANPSNSQ